MGKEVLLKYAFNIKCEELVRDASGKVVELICSVDMQNSTKVKGVLQWVAEPTPQQVIISSIRMNSLGIGRLCIA